MSADLKIHALGQAVLACACRRWLMKLPDDRAARMSAGQVEDHLEAFLRVELPELAGGETGDGR